MHLVTRERAGRIAEVHVKPSSQVSIDVLLQESE
jgi:hypothetical protein